MIDQTEVFSRDEGNAYFQRNQDHFDSLARHDAVLQALAALEGAESLCEVGCANGWRLPVAAAQNPALHDLVGFDLSADAIAAGRKRWPTLDLHVARADQPPPLGRQFDVVVVSFVMHWIDRTLLARSVAAIDGLVRDNGTLILADFAPDFPCAPIYQHRTDVPIFTYKQDYAACFTGLGLYRQIASCWFNHDTHAFDTPEAIPSQQRAVAVTMRKSLAEHYAL